MLNSKSMNIVVIKSHGFGQTTLSAFDAALKSGGIFNYNLISLSSIIPPNSQVAIKKKHPNGKKNFGDRLYVVKADIRSDETGKAIAAGLGWYQFGDNRGVFVEHEIKAETKETAEEELYHKIENSISDLCKFRRVKFEIKKMGFSISTCEVKNQPACALVVAVYKSEPWY